MSGRRILTVGLVILCVCIGSVVESTEDFQQTVGIRLDLNETAKGLDRVELRVHWDQAADEAAVALKAPRDFAAPYWADVSKIGGSFTRSLGSVVAGESTVLDFDLSGLKAGEKIIVAVDRRVGEVTYQAVVSLTTGDLVLQMSDPGLYRIRPAREEDFVSREENRLESHASVTAEPGNEAIVIEALAPKLAATVFAEDSSNNPIQDGYDCNAGGFPNYSFFQISSAPAGATATAITVHVEITHPVMANLDVVFGRTDNFFYWPLLNFLWMEGDAGVNLDRDFTRDRYNSNFGAIGDEVNGYWGLHLRDCVAGNSGTLTYFSVQITYDDPTPDEYDFVADSLVAQSATVEAGSSLDVNWFGQLAAASTGDVAGDFTVGFYLSADSAITAADTLLDRQTVTGPTSPGDSFGFSGHSLSIPGGTTAGAWYVGMLVDDTGLVAETNENNNSRAAAITVTTGGGGVPDLEVSDCSVNPGSAGPGESVTLFWKRRNNGTADVAVFHQAIYLSADQIGGNGGDIKLWENSRGPLAASSSWTNHSVSLDIPPGTIAGSYFLVIFVDDTSAVAESNESNNSCAAAITVGASSGGDVTQWLVPAAASALGANSSDWRTQVVVNNPTSQTRQATVYYVADGASWPGQLLMGPLNIFANRSLFLNDPLVAMRDTTGFLYVVLDQTGPLVTTRTFNLQADGSTFGQGIPAIALTGAVRPSEMVIPLVHSGGGRFRTNLGLVRTSGGGMTVEISIYNVFGTLLGGGTRVVADGWDQFNVFNLFGLGSSVVEGGWIRVRLVGGTPDYWTCYASVIDMDTDDGTYVAGIVTSS